MRVAYRNSKYLKEGLNYYANKIEKYAKEDDSMIVSISYFVLSGFYRVIGLNEYAMYNLKKANSYLDTNKIYSTINAFNGNNILGIVGYSNHLAVLGDSYNLIGDYNLSIQYSYRALSKMDVDTSIDMHANKAYIAANLAESYLELRQMDSVNYFLSNANKELQEIPDAPNQAKVMQIEANYLLVQKKYVAAEDTLLKLKQLIEREKLPFVSTAGHLTPNYYLALSKFEQGKYKEAITMLESELIALNVLRAEALRDYKLLATCYTKIGNANQALVILNKYIALQDSLKSDESKYRSIGFEIEEQLKHNEISINKLENESKTAAISRNYLIGIAGLLCLIALGMYSRFRSKKKANEILSEQKAQIETTLEKLKATQSQLIQSEKMASLGELTAGIAHEIQNPLNFVNNFSEVSKELIDEMNDEVANGNFEETRSIAADLKQNLEKIHHHGKRADAIVKGMLQHSRTNANQKEPTLINAMADEFLRLSYHGLRAKDKSFNASIKTDFDDRIGKVNIAAQDIGRVILNLVNNAFYAVNDRKKLGDANYEPEVFVRTKLLNNKIEISVSDNGNGIPEAVVGKIFQPFFTTKPAGQGTGLGLSLSYDIVKAHGGELLVETKEGEGTEFILKLPIGHSE
ncbi:MAG: hypothetical protein IPI46_06775 [Bacteroidetes bacterium]|nr:hypothetical protein [Bacteroidota bacterium]